MQKFVCTARITDEIKTVGEEGKTVKFKGAVRKNFIPTGETKKVNDFFDMICFREGTAKFIANNFAKDDTIVIVGEVVQNNHKKADGSMVYGYQVVIDEAYFPGGKATAGETAEEGTDEAPAKKSKPATKPAEASTDNEFEDLF